jgi:hypothetical protein
VDAEDDVLQALLFLIHRYISLIDPEVKRLLCNHHYFPSGKLNLVKMLNVLYQLRLTRCSPRQPLSLLTSLVGLLKISSVDPMGF